METRKCERCGIEFEPWLGDEVCCIKCINRENRKEHRKVIYQHECCICGKRYVSGSNISCTCSIKCNTELRRQRHAGKQEEINETIRFGILGKKANREAITNREFTEDTVYLIHKWYYEYTSGEVAKMSHEKTIKTICSILDRSEVSVNKALSQEVPEYQVQKWEELNWKKCKFGGKLNVQES